MKVLLMKYIDKDDSLLCTSQLSMASQQEVRPCACDRSPLCVDTLLRELIACIWYVKVPQPPPSAALKPSTSSSSSAYGAYYDSTQSTSMDSSESTAFEESENSESSLWTSTSEFQTDDPDENADDSDALMMMGPVSQLSQMSQMSQWSEFSSTSNLDEIITFLEKQDTVEHERCVRLSRSCCVCVWLEDLQPLC